MATVTLLMIEIAQFHVHSTGTDARWCWVNMCRKQSLRVYYVMNFINVMHFQLKLLA